MADLSRVQLGLGAYDVIDHVELTQAQYDALPQSEKMSGKVYFITDGTAVSSVDQTYDPTSENAQSGVAVAEAVATLQPMLESGVNIKTVNGNSLLGSGDIAISGGGGQPVPYIERMVSVPLFGPQGTLTAEINPKYSSHFDRSSYTHMMLANIRITHYDDRYLYGFAPNSTDTMFTCQASSEVSAGMLRVGFTTGSLYGTYKGWSSYLNAGLKQHLPGVFSSSTENSVFAGRILLGIETQKSGADAVEEMVWLPLFAHVSMPSGKDDMLVNSLYATYYFPTKFSNGDTINVFAERIEFMISRDYIDFADGYGPYA